MEEEGSEDVEVGIEFPRTEKGLDKGTRGEDREVGKEEVAEVGGLDEVVEGAEVEGVEVEGGEVLERGDGPGGDGFVAEANEAVGWKPAARASRRAACSAQPVRRRMAVTSDSNLNIGQPRYKAP